MARIALILPRLSLYGGVEQFAYRLSEALAEEYDVDFICSRVEVPPPLGVKAVIVGRGCGFRFFKIFWFLIQAERARKRGKYNLVLGLGKSWNQDILRIGGGPQRTFWELSEKAWPKGYARWWKRVRRWSNPTSWLIRYIEKHQVLSQSRIVCVSELVRQWVLNEYPECTCSSVIYNAPDLEKYKVPSREQKIAARVGYDLDMKDVAIVTATSNFILKGTANLIRAVALLPENFKLFIAGGRNTASYKKLVQSLGIEKRVLFMGKIDNMPGLYRAMDIFALPTYYDACSNATLEAKACGLRVLSSVYNGASFFLPENWVTPFPDNAQDLAKRLFSMSVEAPIEQGFVFPDGIQVGISAWLDLVKRTLKAKEVL